MFPVLYSPNEPEHFQGFFYLQDLLLSFIYSKEPIYTFFSLFYNILLVADNT